MECNLVCNLGLKLFSLDILTSNESDKTQGNLSFKDLSDLYETCKIHALPIFSENSSFSVGTLYNVSS